MSDLRNEFEKAISDELQMYAETEYSTQLITAMLSNDSSSHVSIAVDAMSLFESSIAFAHYIFRKPKNALRILDDAFRRVSLTISRSHALKADMVYKENLHVRLVALPNLPEVYRSNLPICSDVGQFLCIGGTVTQTSTAKMLQYKKLWRCSKCKYQFVEEAEVELGYIFEKPIMCLNPDHCNGRNFTLLSTDINTDWCKDYQEIKLQEQVYNLKIGTVPRSMIVILEDDLVETCHPGNDVIVSGILIQRWKPLMKGNVINVELIILAHNIEVQNKLSMGDVSQELANEFGQFWLNHKSDPFKGRNYILLSICPQVFGLYIVKLATALVLAGGVQKKDGNSRIRGNSHLLLIGDPGTAKSQFLKFASKVSPRAVITSGIGTTNAGLTVSAVKESGRWQLEAGALVLADGGVCCIDEFSCIKEQDKTCIHEAMEQQTISVAKAGLVCSLNTRCSILAATNPKGAYDENMSLSENTALGTPLLSRFDVILVLLDKNDEKWDEMVSSYILNGRNFLNERTEELWSLQKIRSYFSLIRQINPQVTAEAERVLRAYYTKQRSLQAKNASRTTPRLLQSLIRLAEGHARLMFRTEVLVCDAIIAIILIESSMVGNSILEGNSPLLTVFPNNPIAELEEKAKLVFQNLNIDLPIKEKYDTFYDESSIQKVLLTISEELNSKDKPYIFENSQNVSNVTEFQNNSDNKEETVSESFGISKNISTAAGTSNSENITAFQETVAVEIHQNNDGMPFETDIIELSSTFNGKNSKVLSKECTESFRKMDSKLSARENVDNLSFLNQILEEDECENNFVIAKSANKAVATDQVSTLSDIKTIFNNKKSEATCSKYFFSENDSTIPQGNTVLKNLCSTQRNDCDILKELGISPEKNFSKKCETVNISPIKNSNVSTVMENTDSLSSFPAKISLAEKLKCFTFSKRQNVPPK